MAKKSANIFSEASAVAESKPSIRASGTTLCINERVSLREAVSRLDTCGPSFTLFVTEDGGAVVGVITGGDVLRHLSKSPDKWPDGPIRPAVTLRKTQNDPEGMFYVLSDGPASSYAQITQRREIDDAQPEHRRRWHRLKLVPVLNQRFHLVDILDVASPRPRARLETLVMAKAFPLRNAFTNEAVVQRRKDFDAIHYKTHFEKILGLCEVLDESFGGNPVMLDDVFQAARTDELVQALGRAEEWLKEHVPEIDISIDEGIAKRDRQKLLRRVGALRSRLAKVYSAGSKSAYFPQSAPQRACTNPQAIVVLGCKEDELLDKRVRAAFDVIRQIVTSSKCRPVIVFSGGGFAHDRTEARSMLDKFGTLLRAVGGRVDGEQGQCHSLHYPDGQTVDVLLEEDSLDTLGNAVFSWFTLKIASRFRMESSASLSDLAAPDVPRLERLLLVTDRIHAPRSYDIFRRIFALRGEPRLLELAVKTVEQHEHQDEVQQALANLRSEAQTNGEVFRLVNLMTNGFDVIADGHGRSILGQMLRLHGLYKARWDLVRKYRTAWTPVAVKMSDAAVGPIRCP